MDLLWVDNLLSSSNNVIPVRFKGVTKIFAYQLLSLQNNPDDFEKDNFVFSYKESNKDAFYFSKNINPKCIFKNIVKNLKFDIDNPMSVEIMSSYNSSIESKRCFKTPVVTFELMKFDKFCMKKVKLNVDVLIFIDENMTLSEIVTEFLNKYNRILLNYAKAFKFLSEIIRSSEVLKLILLYYVFDDKLISIILPENQCDFEKDLLNKIAQEIGIGKSNQLNRSCSLFPPLSVLTGLTNAGQKLISPHLHLNKSDVTDIHLLRGRYTYHHYKQDGFNDRNWGCAYRSMQTILSWYLWQGYDVKLYSTVPSITDIQQILVDIKDKPKSFIGSTNWIGSIEISMVLRELLSVDSRILSLNSGSDINLHFQTLASHFDEGSAPIMIGGGELAHTILGVGYRGKRMQALVLDPHYPEAGKSDLSVVINKGWCGWKDVDNFWKKATAYNLCLPQICLD